MKVLILGATGGTARLNVREAVAKGHPVVALVRQEARASDFAGADLIEGDARDESALHVLKFALSRDDRVEPSRLAIGATATLRTDQRFAIADGLLWQAVDAGLAEELEKNRPIDSDRRRNRANCGSSKFVFEIKSANF